MTDPSKDEYLLRLYIRELEGWVSTLHTKLARATELLGTTDLDPDTVVQKIHCNPVPIPRNEAFIDRVRSTVTLFAPYGEKEKYRRSLDAFTSGEPVKEPEPVPESSLTRAKFKVTECQSDLARGEWTYRLIKDTFNLSGDAKLVLEFIADVERDTGYPGQVFITDKEFMEENPHAHEKAIAKGIAYAKMMGWLEVTEVPGHPDGKNYRITKTPEAE